MLLESNALLDLVIIVLKWTPPLSMMACVTSQFKSITIGLCNATTIA